MVAVRKLDEKEFKACFAEPMTNVTAIANAVVDLWPYVDALDLDEIGVGHFLLDLNKENGVTGGHLRSV
ncbi:MAG: hypothetical protein E5V49_03400 [Mesorhizobium sp.]|nr:hypothetical protein EN848_11995 [bacterium M00.F.Ca.ET.205.01.1.1]TGU55974.1 hypothetical protein EN795_01030 [bacterium M00.F.Ca.ET.152.01.1.1]TGV40601.1 hypothetical protein EN829_003410 [Mesorhizobium sp. M00.F.Ca.ET.186.01.1.1]TGZ45582.1 hypothetical protein EN805_03390 [bacterium M00.F.Ca.ET.162.01.1.1]TIW61544.1 MAG: hypothetical protein E5V48_08775 [Mesorhizobium sp.]